MKKKVTDEKPKSSVSRDDLDRITKLEMESRMVQDERLAKIEACQTKMNDQLVEIDKKFEGVYKKFDLFRAEIKEIFAKMDRSFENADKKFQDVDQRNDNKFEKLDHKVDTVLSRALTMFIFTMTGLIGIYGFMFQLLKH